MYPRAGSETELIGYRAIYGVGAAAISAMLGAVISDYPLEPDRGKATGVMGVMNGLGILITLFRLTKLPHALVRRGVDVADAGLITYGVAAGLCLVTAAVIMRGLVKGRPVDAGPRQPFAVLARRGLAAGRDPGVALAYGAAFVSRGDLVVVGTFLTLWVQRDAAAHGIDSAKALATGGMIAGISQTAAFVWAPVIGYLADRMHRVSVLALALALASAGYLSMGLVTDPTGGLMIAAVCLVGVGEISALITSQVLIAQQAPTAIRGSVLGVFGLFGAFGILVATKVGGHLFDDVAPSPPFVWSSALNLRLLLWAIWVPWRSWVLTH